MKIDKIINHGTYIADEVYKSREYLQKVDKVYSVKDLNCEVLRKLK